MNVRERLTALPFVTTKADGTLDLWAVAPSEDKPEILHLRGRMWAALYVRLLREVDISTATGLHAHLNYAMRDAFPRGCRIAQGFATEIAATICAVPEADCDVLRVAGSYNFTSDLMADLDKLPWTRVVGGQLVSGWEPHVTGDYTQDKATGRFYGAILCKMIRQTGWLHILGTQPVTPAEHEPLLIGCFHVIAELCHLAPWGATPAQRSVEALLTSPEALAHMEYLETLPDLSDL